MSTMRALLYTEEYTLEIRDVPRPQPLPDEVLLRVDATGICGSDIHGVGSRSARRTPPLIMGHELTGEVVAAGSVAGTELVGQRVVVNPQMPCGHCRACRSGSENVCQHRDLLGGTRPGGLAEFVAVPLRCVHMLPAGVPPETAVFAEPLATVVHALRFATERYLDTVVIFGGGAVGLLAAVLVRSLGAATTVVVEPQEARRLQAESVADLAVAPEQVAEALDRLAVAEGVSLSIDAVGLSSTRAASVALLQPSGHAIWLGMESPDATIAAFDIVTLEQRVQGSFAYTDADFATATALLEREFGKCASWGYSVSLSEGRRVFDDLVAGEAPDFVKAVIRPGL